MSDRQFRNREDFENVLNNFLAPKLKAFIKIEYTMIGFTMGKVIRDEGVYFSE